jgi:hypothetical protein
MRFQFFGRIPNFDSFCIFFVKLAYLLCATIRMTLVSCTVQDVRANRCDIICKLKRRRTPGTQNYPKIALHGTTTVAGRPVVVPVVSLLPIISNGT